MRYVDLGSPNKSVHIGMLHHIINKYDKMSLYSSTFEDCSKTLNQESKDFRKTHIMVSDKKYSRIISKKPIL